ncbi:MAG: type II toxin-antitoxin system VapC family toxin [Bdellovibrionota bacterium]
MIINLDTHIVLKFLNRDLTKTEFSLMESFDQYCISDMVLWELAMLRSRKGIDFRFDSPEWLEFSRDIQVLPITQEIALQTTKMDFKADPADHIIAATSIVHQIPLMTRDKTILKSKIVPFPK